MAACIFSHSLATVGNGSRAEFFSSYSNLFNSTPKSGNGNGNFARFHRSYRRGFGGGYRESIMPVCNSVALNNGASSATVEKVVVLVIGGGGREHALCYALKRSSSCDAQFPAQEMQLVLRASISLIAHP